MSSITDEQVRSRLRALSDGYRDALRPPTRARILASARQAARSTSLLSPFVPAIPRLLAAAAVAVILALPALHLRPRPGVDAGSPVRDLQVTESGGQVVLTWKDGRLPRRVVRATSREDLAHLSELPSELVTGERWVDSRPTDATVVFYLVE